MNSKINNQKKRGFNFEIVSHNVDLKSQNSEWVQSQSFSFSWHKWASTVLFLLKEKVKSMMAYDAVNQVKRDEEHCCIQAFVIFQDPDYKVTWLKFHMCSAVYVHCFFVFWNTNRSHSSNISLQTKFGKRETYSCVLCVVSIGCILWL